REAAHAAPSTARMFRADVRPFREVGAAEDDRAGASEVRHDRSTGGTHVLCERQRSGSRWHAGNVNIVLYQDGQPIEGAARLAVRTACIRSARLACSLWIQPDYGVHLRVEPVDSGFVTGDQRLRGGPMRREIGGYVRGRLADRVIAGCRGDVCQTTERACGDVCAHVAPSID